ncbi:MAG: hypothetical protein B6241_14095 [Spirochaetaceae bacterium 4572_59]|nr:MAG: hypothetical protein B6241_14095 [Spirochaetaceae bacterium 4572_59]
MNKKKQKLPTIFKKKYSEKKLKKKILKRIHIPKDREMIKELFIPGEKGKFEIVQEIPEELRPRLKALAKSIKKNKGVVTTWKAAIILIIVGSALVFNLFFKDRVIKQVLEQGLESVFQAESSVKKPQLSLLKGVFSYESLQIADSGDLSRNLIETGSASFKISIAELTRKRIHIEESSLSGVQWDTERETVAKAKESKSEEGTEGDKKESPLDVLALSSDEMDYKSLLEEQKENLKSFKLIDSGNEKIDAFIEKWSGIFDEKEKEIRNITKEVESLKTINPRSIVSLDQVLSAKDQIESVYPKVEETRNSLMTLRSDFLEEKDQLTGLYDEVQDVMEDDIYYLKGLTDFSSGDMKSLASGAAEKYIRKRWNDYYEKGLKALEVYEKFKTTKSENTTGDKQKELRREGRSIPFYSPELPDVLVKKILLSGGTDDTGVMKIEVNSLTDDPDKLDEPSSFQAEWLNGSTSITLDGIADGRTNAQQPFFMEILSPSNIFEINDGISTLQIDALKSQADISGISYSVPEKEGIMTELKIQLKDIEIVQKDSDNFIAEAVLDIMSTIETVDVEAEILVTRSGIEKIRVKTDLDNILSDKIGDYIKGMADRYEEEIREYLTAYISDYLEGNELLMSAMNAIGADSLDQLSSVDGIKKLLDSKIDEIESEKQAIIDKAEKLMAEAEARIKTEADAAEKKAREEAARLKAEADAAERKAREKADKALQDAADKVKLPGF